MREHVVYSREEESKLSKAVTSVPHIRLDAEGRATIEGTSCKVVEIALDHLAHGWSPEEIFIQHYRQISLAQIHAALSYYYDHKPEMDVEIGAQVRRVEDLRAREGESPFLARMKAEGRL
ncbi:MAG: DUF433 domain-containing protein [Acidobacteria bacterium]|nr:DUF433 domain-containing protein [Acidobacteriota bacterium]